MCVILDNPLITLDNPLSCCYLYPIAKKIASALRTSQAILEDPFEAF